MAKILIVDDDKKLLLLYRRDLEEEGYEVITAGEADAGLERFRSERPDVVVLDVRMPGSNGLEVMKRILSLDRHVPVIINSAYSCYKDDFLCWLADAYILKSSDLAELKETIRELVSPCDHAVMCAHVAET